MKSIPGLDGPRRLNPRMWDYNWRQLRLIRAALEAAVNFELQSHTGAVVVDFGCGERPYEPLFSGRVGRYVAVDIAGNPQADVTFEPGAPTPLGDGCANLVLSSQVLEHVVDVDPYLSECYRILKPGGLLLLSTHGSWVYHPYPVDVRRWTCWGLRYEIERHGFRVESQRGCLGPLAYTTQLRLQLLRGLLWQAGRITAPIIAICSLLAQGCMVMEDWITPRTIREENSAVYVVAARKP